MSLIATAGPCCILAVLPKNRTASQTFIEAARRRQIVDAVIDVIADEGYELATFERIARRAGISRGLISYHFESRDELMAAVVARAYEDGAAYMASRLAAAPRYPRDLLRVYLQSNVEYLRDHRRELLALIAVREGQPVGPPPQPGGPGPGPRPAGTHPPLGSGHGRLPRLRRACNGDRCAQRHRWPSPLHARRT